MKSTIFVLVLVGMMLILSYSVETVSASSTKTITVSAGNKYTIWTDLNTGDRFQVSISVLGGANDDVNLVVTDPQGKILVSGRVNQQYSTEVVADVTGRYNFEFDNSFSVVSDKQVIFTYDKVSQSQNPNTSSSNPPQTQPSQTSTPQEIDYYLYVEPAPNFAPSYVTNSISYATNYWEKIYPNVKFYTAQTENQANVFAQWVKDFGQIRKGEEVSGHTIEIGLGDSYCLGNWQPYSEYTVDLITAHELGHILGLQHNSDPQSIMYEGGTPVQYGQITIQKSLAAGYVWFVPFCTFKDQTSFSYSVTSDDPTYGFKVYVVPSRSEIDMLTQNNLSFNHYSSTSCFGENYLTYSGTCDGIPKGSGLLIILENKQTNDLTQLTITQQEVPFTTGTMQTTTSTTVTYDYPSKAQETQATIQKAVSAAQLEAQSQIDAAAKAKSQAEAQSQADAQAKTQAEAQATAAAQAQAQAEAQTRAAENAKVEAQKQAQADAEKAKADAEKAKIEAENKLKEIQLAYDKKTLYRTQIDNLKDSLKNSENVFSGLKIESPDAKSKIQQAWDEKGKAISDIDNAEKNWILGNQALNQTDSSLAISYFESINANAISVGNHIKTISNLTNDAQKMDAEYKKHRLCILFWCFNI